MNEITCPICGQYIDVSEVYQQGRKEMINEVAEKMAYILAEKCEKYGVVCIEAYNDSFCDLENWVAEQLKEKS